MTQPPRRKPPPTPLPAAAQPPVQLLATVLPLQAPPQKRPHDNLERAARGALAKLSGGVSPHAFIEAWSDWAQHLARSPARQMELAERARQNLLKVMALAASPGSLPPFPPKPCDKRFAHPGWQTFPFRLWQQGFLAVQDWWDEATEPMRGLRREDGDRTRFLARQTLYMLLTLGAGQVASGPVRA